MSLPVQVPSWFSDFPDFSVDTASVCRDEARALGSLLVSFAFDIESATECHESGHWFEEYSYQSRIAKYWLGDASSVLAQLVRNIDEVISQAEQAEREKKLVLDDLLRRAKVLFPAPFLFVMGGYEYLKGRSCPLGIPSLGSPDIMKAGIERISSRRNEDKEIKINATSLSRSFDMWDSMETRYNQSLKNFEDSTSAWEKDCNNFSPANFDSLLASLNELKIVITRQKKHLMRTVYHFAQTDASLAAQFGISLPSLKNDKGEDLKPTGVIYLNKDSGAAGNGHAAVLLIYEDGSATLYSYGGDEDNITSLYGIIDYNDAHVNTYHYSAEELETIFAAGKDDDGEYNFYTPFDENSTTKGMLDVLMEHPEGQKYGLGVYTPITVEQGRALEASIVATIADVNAGDLSDTDSYNVTNNNCDNHAQAWLKDAGVELHIEEDDVILHQDGGAPLRPNTSYESAEKHADKDQKTGDVKKLWEETRSRKPSS